MKVGMRICTQMVKEKRRRGREGGERKREGGGKKEKGEKRKRRGEKKKEKREKEKRKEREKKDPFWKRQSCSPGGAQHQLPQGREAGTKCRECCACG